METPEEKTARIQREIEEERAERHRRMDKTSSVKKKIKKSEEKEHKRIKREQRKGKITCFLKSDKFKNYTKLFIKFILLILTIVLIIIFWEMVGIWLLWLLKWIILPLVTILLFMRFVDNESRYFSPERKRGLVFVGCGLCIWIMYAVGIFEEIQENLEENWKRILPLCAIIITYKVVGYINSKKEQ